jgi:hypothetical protein
MASLTAHFLVPKIQHKTGAVVVEIRTLRLRTLDGKELQQGKNRDCQKTVHRQTSQDVLQRHESS